MIIERIPVGAGRKRSAVFCVCSTPIENGSERTRDICRLDSLESAALVLRYLSGAAMEPSEARRALEIMTQADAKRAAEA